MKISDFGEAVGADEAQLQHYDQSVGCTDTCHGDSTSIGSGDGTYQQQIRPPAMRKSRNVPILLSSLLVGTLPSAIAQSCISLQGSTACPAFSTSSISTNSNLTGLFPFLSSVTDLSSFDSGLQTYISGDFASEKYKALLGCSSFRSDNTTDFYARYTASVLCNAIIQNSISPCGLSGSATRPLCAESCAEYAQSEEDISASNICGTAGSGALSQIRADFTNCALPANSLTQSCIQATDNQPDNCGYSSNLSGLCSYCGASSPNATDSCCVFSDTTTRCKGVSLPIIASSSLQPITTTALVTSSPTTSTTHTSTGAATTSKGLTGGQIAGIVVGALVGALALLGLVIFGCLCVRRRRESSPPTSVFNQPATRKSPPMGYNDGAREQERAGLAVLPGARVARMAALEGSDSYERHRDFVGPGYPKSTSDESSPRSAGYTGMSALPQRGRSRAGSAQLASVLAAADAGHSTPSSDNDYTSPESQGHSEQLAFFKDYYSQDEIHTGDVVSTLWAYEPRAADEFHLERGDMIKMLGIWDDGWATGVRVRQKAEDWRPQGTIQRDSGLSNGSSSSTSPQSVSDGEVKAFPLVCVCLPQHWRKIIDGESTEGSGPGTFLDLP